MPKSKNIKWHNSVITAELRQEKLKSVGCVVWLTGFSGSGKSTIARELEALLIQNGHFSYVLDGDNMRHGLNSDLGFSAEDRFENIRRVGEVSNLFADAGIIAIAAFISPYRKDRNEIRKKLPNDKFIEVHVKASIDECKKRDPKGLYKKAMAGEINHFTGISAPYEAPLNPELVLETQKKTVSECALEVFNELSRRGFLF